MTIKKWLRLFWTTLAVGTAAAMLTGTVLIAAFDDFTLMELSEPGFNWQTILFILLAGSTVSVISHVGFFSYLIVRDIFLGLLRSNGLWNLFQIVGVCVAFEMLTYVRWQVFGSDGESWVSYTALPLTLLIAAAGTAAWKTVLTNRAGFVPTLFFMYGVTVLEALPALRLNSLPSVFFMMVPLLASNAWQILTLPRFLKKKKEPAAG